MSDLKEFDISSELWREYEYFGVTYRIELPQKLFIRDGGTTHRVVDSEGIVHCPPVPGSYGCILRWKNKDPKVPVNF